MAIELEGRSIARLVPAFKTKETKVGYLIKLRLFLEFCNLGPDDFVATTRKDPGRAEELVTSYILARREKVSGSTMHNFSMALKLFLAMNDSDRLIAALNSNVDDFKNATTNTTRFSGWSEFQPCRSPANCECSPGHA